MTQEPDSAFFEERREHLRTSKARSEAPERLDDSATGQLDVDDRIVERRSYPRLSMTIPLRLKPATGGATHTVENYDISWGGLRFIAPQSAVIDSELVTISLPWSSGKRITAEVRVLRKEPLDDGHCMVAGQFSELATSDNHRLEKLLQMLRGRDEDGGEKEASLVPILEILFDDVAEIREKLAEISEGRLSVTTFEPYKTRQSIRLVLGGVADAPALRLRAWVEEARAVSLNARSDWITYDLDLRFQHPLAELKAVARSLERYLPSQESQSVPEYDSYILLDPLD